MQQLSGLDASFLYGETKSHVPSVTATSGTTSSPSIARRAASFWAADMPS